MLELIKKEDIKYNGEYVKKGKKRGKYHKLTSEERNKIRRERYKKMRESGYSVEHSQKARHLSFKEFQSHFSSYPNEIKKKEMEKCVICGKNNGYILTKYGLMCEDCDNIRKSPGYLGT